MNINRQKYHHPIVWACHSVLSMLQWVAKGGVYSFREEESQDSFSFASYELQSHSWWGKGCRYQVRFFLNLIFHLRLWTLRQKGQLSSRLQLRIQVHLWPSDHLKTSSTSSNLSNVRSRTMFYQKDQVLLSKEMNCAPCDMFKSKPDKSFCLHLGYM